ncbi:hypothetical protein JZ751_016793 [Albula glossodonta]|uniref:Uncharacterized protein n=1 Tax=Albula glossodonta TaxID=121402 RepID=A0A8T2NT69_9TELE|nr:hypothetical protein JZ751_016793 [Albula glossodonta]
MSVSMDQTSWTWKRGAERACRQGVRRASSAEVLAPGCDARPGLIEARADPFHLVAHASACLLKTCGVGHGAPAPLQGPALGHCPSSINGRPTFSVLPPSCLALSVLSRSGVWERDSCAAGLCEVQAVLLREEPGFHMPSGPVTLLKRNFIFSLKTFPSHVRSVQRTPLQESHRKNMNTNFGGESGLNRVMTHSNRHTSDKMMEVSMCDSNGERE